MSGMGAISLTPFDLALAATLVVALAMLSYAASLGLARQILSHFAGSVGLAGCVFPQYCQRIGSGG